MAKHLEHAVKDFRRAAEIVERARAYCAAQSELLESLYRYDEAARMARWLPLFERRVRRLQDKIRRQ